MGVFSKMLDGLFFLRTWLNGALVSNVPRDLEIVAPGVTHDTSTGRSRFDFTNFNGNGIAVGSGTEAGQKPEWSGAAWTKQRSYVTVNGADPTGLTDSTNAIRSALNAARPGQVVFLPDGRYLVNHASPITVPYGVTFCGSERGMNVGPFWHSATTALGHMGTQLFVTGTGNLLAMQHQSAVKNLEIYYPNQNGASAETGHGTFSGTPVSYGWTIDAFGADDVTIENVLGINPLDFIRVGQSSGTGGNGGTIRNITGWPLRTGILLGRCPDTVRISKVQFNRSSMLQYYDTALLTWVQANCQALIIDGAEQYEITDFFAFSVWRGLVFRDVDADGFKLCRGTFKGGGFDSCGICILVDQPNGINLQGLSISDAYLSSAGSIIVFQDTTATTDNDRPTINATNVSFGGTCTNAVKLLTGSYGRFKQTLGNVRSNSGPAFYAQSNNSSIRLYGVDVNSGVGNRTGGTGDIEDIYYGSAP